MIYVSKYFRWSLTYLSKAIFFFSFHCNFESYVQLIYQFIIICFSSIQANPRCLRRLFIPLLHKQK